MVWALASYTKKYISNMTERAQYFWSLEDNSVKDRLADNDRMQDRDNGQGVSSPTVATESLIFTCR